MSIAIVAFDIITDITNCVSFSHLFNMVKSQQHIQTLYEITSNTEDVISQLCDVKQHIN